MSASHAGSISFALPSIDTSPQLELFGVTGKDTYSVLAPHLWRLQKGVLARCSAAVSERQAAEAADSERSGADFCPLETDYPWLWPDYRYLYGADTDPPVPIEQRLPYLPQSTQPNANLQAVFDEISRHIASALSRPCPVRTNGYQTRVEFLDSMAWVVSRERRCVYLEVRDVNGHWQLYGQSFVFSQPLLKPFWLDQVLLPWISRIDQVFGERAVDAHWRLRKNLEHRFHDADTLAALTQQIRFHFDVAPALRDAIHKLHDTGARIEPTNESYNYFWQEESAWVGMAEFYPQLLHLYYLSRRNSWLEKGSGVGELRELCRARGLSRAGWRFLSRHGEAAYEEAFFCTDEDGVSIEELLCFIDWQAKAGLEEPLHGGAVSDLYSCDCVQKDENGRYFVAIDPRIAKVQQAYIQSLEDRNEGDLEEVIYDYAHRTVLYWLRDQRPAFDRNQWKSGWPAISRACQRWLKERPDMYCWSPLLEPFIFNQWSVKPLVGSNQLALEGVRMKHCVMMYAERCRQGVYKVFAVEDAQTGQALATIGINLKSNKWELDQARGKFNRVVQEELKPLVAVIIEDANKLPVCQTGRKQPAK